MSDKWTPKCTNIIKATPEELKWLASHNCKHGHKMIAHFNCFLKEHNIEEKVGCLDIEASNLDANFGVMLSWAIKPVSADYTYYDCLTLEDIDKGTSDKRIVESCVERMLEFDRLVGHYSCRFDFPFIRTRALHHKLYFPEYGLIYQTDVWMMAKKKLKLHSNRQDCVAECLLGENIKTRLHPQKWQEVQFGTKAQRREGLRYVLDHNLRDVEQLEANYLALKPFVKETRTSI
jgi:uncharacterized protein YprB with RNaseH-like and TPR domain